MVRESDANMLANAGCHRFSSQRNGRTSISRRKICHGLRKGSATAFKYVFDENDEVLQNMFSEILPPVYKGIHPAD